MGRKVGDFEISEDAFALKDFLDALLQKVRDVYDLYNVPLPARQYWTFGEPAFDCEQVVVSFINLYLGPPGDEAATPRHCNQPRTAVVRISVVRQTATQSNTSRSPVPSAQSIQEASNWQAVDAWVLVESNKLFDQWDEDMGMPGLGVISTITAGTAAGGYQDVSMTLTMAVP